MRSFFLFLICLISTDFLAQAPGGVTSNLRGWYNANTGITLTGGFVSGWNDQSGNNFDGAQATASYRPAQNTAGFNYNTSITFDGQDNFLNIPDLVASATTGLSAFAVARQTAAGRDQYGCILVGQTNNIGASGGYGLTAQVSTNNSFGVFIRDFGTNYVAQATTLSAPTVMSGIWNGTTANAVQYFSNGTSQGTDNYTPGSIGDNGNSYIGSGVGSGTDYCFYGDIAEIVVYNAGLNATDVSKIESYLALKHGITKSGNYLNSAGTTVFSPATPYTSNIIAISRDDNSNLYQKQSKNYDDSTRIFISTLAAANSANTGTFTNNQFVIIAANTARLSGILTEKPTGIYSRIQREWKVTNTGFTSTFNFSIKLNALGVPGSVTTSNLRLLVDDDGDFSNATAYSTVDGLTFSYTTPLITVQGISTSMIASGATKYITIGTNSSATPLPIELLNFEALVCETEVCLNWETASENGNDHFNLERSTDGKTWEVIKEIKGAGYSNIKLSYSEIDHEPLKGLAYYQLQQVDMDNQSSYSPVTSVDFVSEEKKEILLYPNPAADFVLIDGLNTNFVSVHLTNTLGEHMPLIFLNGDMKDEPLKLDTHTLSEGFYYLTLQDLLNNKATNKNIKFVIHR